MQLLTEFGCKQENQSNFDKSNHVEIWKILPNLRACPLSVDMPLYRQKPPFQNGESRQL